MGRFRVKLPQKENFRQKFFFKINAEWSWRNCKKQYLLTKNNVKQYAIKETVAVGHVHKHKAVF